MKESAISKLGNELRTYEETALDTVVTLVAGLLVASGGDSGNEDGHDLGTDESGTHDAGVVERVVLTNLAVDKRGGAFRS